jgi:methylated-DNA-[protein]-cysteine S-methyltransferase
VPEAFHLFPTAIGWCGIAWNDAGVAGLQLPEGDVARTRQRMRRRFPSAPEQLPPERIAEVVTAITSLLHGELVDLTWVPLDISRVDDFDQRVYTVARTIPPATTTTYGAIARRLGSPTLAQAVGRSLGRNPFPIVVPCHRVVAAGGRSGGFSAHGGVATKQRMLLIEGPLSSELDHG